MERIVFLLTATVLVAGIYLAGTGTAAAEPGKNRIEATASCSNRETYTFVINGMGKAWQIQGSNSNLIVKSYTLIYSDPDTGDLIGSDTFGGGEKNGRKRDLITCEGEVTTVLEGIGEVTVDATFEAFVTPRGAK